jgi:hypothetical protein
VVMVTVVVSGHRQPLRCCYATRSE